MLSLLAAVITGQQHAGALSRGANIGGVYQGFRSRASRKEFTLGALALLKMNKSSCAEAEQSCEAWWASRARPGGPSKSRPPSVCCRTKGPSARCGVSNNNISMGTGSLLYFEHVRAARDHE